MLWAVAFACFDSTPDWQTLFTEDPTAVVGSLQEMDPVQRLAVIQQLQEQFPGKTSVLCETLDGSTKSYCLERELRPHLWMQQKQEEVKGSNKISTTSSKCSDFVCKIDEAKTAAMRGRVDLAVSICQGGKTTQFHECLFMVAEKIVSARGTTKYDTAVEICEQADSFSNNCHNHLIQQMAKNAPDADTAADWSEIFQAHRALETTWGWRDREQLARLQTRLWSESIGVAFSGADQIVGNTFDVLPKETRAHIHSSAAWRLFQLNDPKTHNLQDWSEILNNKLQQRSEKPAALDQQRRFRAASNLWNPTSDKNFPDEVYLSTSRRWVSEDSMTDITIAILEAVARHPPVQISIIEAGLEHNNLEVRATSKRLLALLETLE